MSGAARIATVLKRDWRLFWPLAAGVAVWQILQRATLEPDTASVDIATMLSTLTREPPMRYLPVAAAWLTMLVIATLIIVLVQEDDIPGPRGDWLTRPVKRFETLAAKALFVLGGVTLPGFVAGVIYALVQATPVGLSLLYAGGRTVGDLVSFTLPVFLLASMTSTFAEAAIIALLVAGASYLFQPSQFLRMNGGLPPADGVWIVSMTRLALVLAVAAPLSILQYRRPNRWIVRGVAAAALAGWIALNYMTREDQARVSLAFSPDATAGAAVVLPMDKPVGPDVLARVRPCPRGGSCSPIFALPRADGVPEDALVQLDASRMRVLDGAGKVIGVHSLNFTSGAPIGPTLAMLADDKQRKQFFEQMAGVRESRYGAEGDLVLTLLEPGGRFELPTDGKSHFLAGLGSCRARFDESSPNTIQMICRQIGTAPDFIVATLKGNPPPKRCSVEAQNYCRTYAAPFLARLLGRPATVAAYLQALKGAATDKVYVQTYVTRAHVNRVVPLKPLNPASLDGTLPASTSPPPLQPAGGGPR